MDPKVDNNNEETDSTDFNFLFENAPEPSLQSAAYASSSSKTPPPKSEAQSKWMNWSKSRRQSYQDRMKKLEERLMAEEKLKHDTSRQAIKKAKKEASKFIDPEYASKLKEEKLKTISAQVDDRPKIFESDSDSEDEYALKKAAEELKESAVISGSRKLGVCLSVAALILVCTAAGMEKWTLHSSEFGKISRGLFTQCFDFNVTQSVEECKNFARREWHNVVAGLLFASLIMNLLGSILAFAGLCSVLLMKKLFFYHSAAEAFIVSALSIACSVLLFFIMSDSDAANPLITILASPGLCCGALLLQIIAAIIMNVDIIIFRFQQFGRKK